MTPRANKKDRQRQHQDQRHAVIQEGDQCVVARCGDERGCVVKWSVDPHDRVMEHEFRVIESLRASGVADHFVEAIRLDERGRLHMHDVGGLTLFSDAYFEHFYAHRDIAPHEYVSLILQVLCAVRAAQRACGFTHNDLHTNNILVRPVHSSVVNVYDFGPDAQVRVPTFGQQVVIIDMTLSHARYATDRVLCSAEFMQYGIGPAEDAAYDMVKFLSAMETSHFDTRWARYVREVVRKVRVNDRETMTVDYGDALGSVHTHIEANFSEYDGDHFSKFDKYFHIFNKHVPYPLAKKVNNKKQFYPICSRMCEHLQDLFDANEHLEDAGVRDLLDLAAWCACDHQPEDVFVGGLDNLNCRMPAAFEYEPFVASVRRFVDMLETLYFYKLQQIHRKKMCIYKRLPSLEAVIGNIYSMSGLATKPVRDESLVYYHC